MSRPAGSGGSRRQFIKSLLPGWLGMVIAPAIYAWLRSTALGQKENRPEGPMIVGPLRNLPIGSSVIVSYASDRVLIVRVTDQEIVALSAVCTHLGCVVRHEFNARSHNIVCSCHNSSFALDGEILTGPAPMPLTQYKTRIVNQEIELSAADS